MVAHSDSPSIIFSSDFYHRHARLSAEELDRVLQKVSEILEKEPKLVPIDRSRVMFLGDTHGNFEMTIHALKHLFPPKGSSHTNFDKVVFLGDFIDRGDYSIENINLLMSMKAIAPDRLILIRGNHETRETNIRFDFYEKVIRRYGLKMFERYNQIFAKLPLAVMTWNKIFAVHGGVPEGLENIADINGVGDMLDPDDRVVFQLLWNDPIEKDGWFFKNFRGSYSQRFGREAFAHFMQKHDIKLFVRAHEVQKDGYKAYFNAQLISLDSSTTPRGKDAMKLFIVEPSGEYRVVSVQDFEHLPFNKIFGTMDT